MFVLTINIMCRFTKKYEIIELQSILRTSSVQRVVYRVSGKKVPPIIGFLVWFLLRIQSIKGGNFFLDTL